MDFVIVFFRDVLDGPLYIAVSIVCSILICSCIGYMGEKYLVEKKGVKPEQILVVSFTNKAVQELRDKLNKARFNRADVERDLDLAEKYGICRKLSNQLINDAR